MDRPLISTLAISSPPESLQEETQPSYGLGATMTFTAFALRVCVRDRTVIWLVALFLTMVIVAAYLGWSASETVTQIYAQASAAFHAQGKAIPPNPLEDVSPLSILRNMTTYVSLLGALVSIVLGARLVDEDRRSGVFALIASRPVARRSYAFGKIAALVTALIGLLFVSAIANAGAILVIPGAPLTKETWIGLSAFYAASALFLVAFGLMAIASAGVSRSESVGLLVPVTVWLALTFVVPQLSANINPMAALNPISATAEPPSGAFFETMGPLLQPISLTSAYREIAALVLGFAPDGAATSMARPLLTLAAADVVMAIAAFASLLMINPTRSGTDD